MNMNLYVNGKYDVTILIDVTTFTYDGGIENEYRDERCDSWLGFKLPVTTDIDNEQAIGKFKAAIEKSLPDVNSNDYVKSYPPRADAADKRPILSIRLPRGIANERTEAKFSFKSAQ